VARRSSPSFIPQTDGSSSITENTINNAGSAIVVQDVARPVTIEHILSNGLGAGAVVESGAMRRLRSPENSIFGNGGLGIDLNGDGVPQRPGDLDLGPNNLQEFFR
jgi:hypothetical protein